MSINIIFQLSQLRRNVHRQRRSKQVKISLKRFMFVYFRQLLVSATEKMTDRNDNLKHRAHGVERGETKRPCALKRNGVEHTV